MRRTAIAVGAVMFLTAAAAGSGPLASAISPQDAVAGKRAIVCGDLGAVHLASSTPDGSALFIFDVPASAVPVSILIAKSERSQMSPNLEKHLLGRQVCIDGLVTERDGQRLIRLTTLSQVRFIGGPPLLPVDFLAGAAHEGDPGLMDAKMAAPPKFQYTVDMMRAKIRGSIQMAGVISERGTVERIRVVQSLDPFLGADDEALMKVLQWRFTPATRGGTPVPMLATFEVSFELDHSGARVGSVPIQLSGNDMTRILPAPAAVDPTFGGGQSRAGTPGVTTPKIIEPVAPHYPIEALRAGLSGEVLLDAVVGSDGRVTHARVARSLSGNLGGVDDEAVECVSAWIFTPGKVNDVPAPTVVQIGVTFRIIPAA